jgi:endonuclease III
MTTGTDRWNDEEKPRYADLVFAAMASARIHGTSAKRGSDAILERWGTPRKLIDAPYDQVRACLTENGYARYDIQRAGWLCMMSRQIIERGMPHTEEEVSVLHGCGPMTVKILRENCDWWK